MSLATRLEAARKRLAARKARLAKAKRWRDRIPAIRERVSNTTRKVRDLEAKAAKPSVWNPAAKRVVYSDAGPFVTGAPKLVWHTTEGSSLPSYAGSAPHFTLNPRTGDLWQHIPIDRSAKALLHPAGTVETNRAHAIQVELIGFAATSQDWPASAYAEIAKLARWIEANAGVKRRCGVTFTGQNVSPHRMGSAEWIGYDGHCGHQHVPNNQHWDPGKLRINLVL